MAYSQQLIEDELEKLRQRKLRNEGSYSRPKDYQNFTPKTLGFKPRDTTILDHMNDVRNRRDETATDIAEIKNQNRQAYREMVRQRRDMIRAQKSLKRARNNVPKYNPNVKGGHIHQGEEMQGGRPASFPVGVGDHLKTINWRGHSLTLNEYAIPRFVGFLNALYQKGYRPVTIGSYSNRNIAGSSQKSLHAYGLAIDIDPSKNPVQYGSNRHALPPRVAALAAKYGLSWGGSWNSYKDPMHFSVPYGGRE